MREYELIDKMIKSFPRSKDQCNKFLSCDAEIVQIGKEVLAITVDDFSPEEDFFTSEDPFKLGHNLVVATLSDLFAAGAEPMFFLQSVALKKDIAEDFLSQFTAGIQKTLQDANCFLCGGDFSTANDWRYTGVAIGKIANDKYIQRILPDIEQMLWITGSLGDANLAVITQSPTPLFELRINEAKLIKQYATACIDTSSGFFDAVFCMHKLKHDLTIEIDIDKVPFAHGLEQFTKKIGTHREAALVGGAGEYELLFATPKNLPTNIQQKLIDAGITPIGQTYFHNYTRGVFVCKNKIKNKVEQLPPCPREANSFEDYLNKVIQFTDSIIGQRII